MRGKDEFSTPRKAKREACWWIKVGNWSTWLDVDQHLDSDGVVSGARSTRSVEQYVDDKKRGVTEELSTKMK